MTLIEGLVFVAVLVLAIAWTDGGTEIGSSWLKRWAGKRIQRVRRRLRAPETRRRAQKRLEAASGPSLYDQFGDERPLTSREREEYEELQNRLQNG